jgi:hypothetical protein
MSNDKMSNDKVCVDITNFPILNLPILLDNHLTTALGTAGGLSGWGKKGINSIYILTFGHLQLVIPRRPKLTQADRILRAW